MSSDRRDDFDDIPDLLPVTPSERELRADYRDPLFQPRPGFGFWMAVVWSIFFFAVTQIILGLMCGVPIIGAAVFLEARQKNGPLDSDELMKSDTFQLAAMLTVTGAHVGGVLFSWLILRWQLGRSWKRKIALTRRPTGTHIALVLIGVVALLATGTVVDHVVGRFVPSLQDLLQKIGFNFPMQGSDELIPEMVNKSPWLLALFTVGVLPAFDEEFWCRGFLANGLAQRYRAWAVVLIVSFLFGAMHVDPRQGTGAMFLGVAMHLAYLATRSLWVPMALHFFNNGLAVLHIHERQPLVGVLKPLEDALAVAPWLFVPATILLTAAVAYALYQTRCKLVAAEPGLPTWEPPGVSSVELPPKGSGTIVTHDPLAARSVIFVLIASVVFALVLALA
jgi:membrane protease YdiL (CAAX protease family)